VISVGTIAENAVLEIEKIPIKVKCSGCGGVSSVNIRKFRCPVCSGQNLKILQGKEFYIESIGVEQIGDKDCKTDNGVE
jgi:hydrogenase nickel incorporation protein HypA/HybF